MKAKLLKKLRATGRAMINILSITKSDGVSVGMKYSYNSDDYSGLFEFGDSPENVRKKAEKIYLKKYLESL